MNFWNGNKSSARQDYELKVLECILATNENILASEYIFNDLTDHPKAEDEANIFAQGCDILVTVAGNKKFVNKEKIVIPLPIAKGLLGYRLLVVKKENLIKFSSISSPSELQKLSIGIPNTWADADLFRTNNYKVVEEGSFNTLFTRLQNDEFDYIALGVNEIEDAYDKMAKSLGTLVIEPTLMLYYPFPLVFYVNPKQPELANRIQIGLEEISKNGQLDDLFNCYYGSIVERLSLKERSILTLENSILPESMQNFSANLLD